MNPIMIPYEVVEELDRYEAKWDGTWTKYWWYDTVYAPYGMEYNWVSYGIPFAIDANHAYIQKEYDRWKVRQNYEAFNRRVFDYYDEEADEILKPSWYSRVREKLLGWWYNS